MKPRRQRSSQFGAPWGRSVQVVTILVIILMVGVMVTPPVIMFAANKFELAGWIAPIIVAVSLVVLCLFGVRGYTLRKDELWIQRPFWQTRLSLKGLERAYADKEAMKGAIKTAGNGGFLAFTGWFRNKRLGSFRAFVTDPARAVVLEFPNRKVLVSPDDPDVFVRALGQEPGNRRSMD